MTETVHKLLNGFIIVEFEEKKNIIGGIELHIPERFLVQDNEDETGKHYAVTTDRRLINPQVCNVIKGNKDVPTGARCFVHYGAIEVAQPLTDTKYLIRSAMVFFTLDPITPFPGNYLGHEIFTQDVKTESGIILKEGQKEACNVKITHVPENSKIKVGDIVITIDAKQYTLKYGEENFIKLKDSEIIGTIENDRVIPYDNYLLVEYVEKENLVLKAENEYKAHLRDIAIKYQLHCPDVDFTPVQPLSKFVDAKLLAYGSKINWIGSSSLLVERNRGALLPDGKWIINMDAIVGTNG